MDLLQVRNEQIYNGHREVFDGLYHFVETSFDEDDGQDVDLGVATRLIDELISGGIAGFFPIRPERVGKAPWNRPDFYESCAAGCATVYTETLSAFLFDQYCGYPGKRRPYDEIYELIGQDSLWLAEVERIHSDLSLVRNYPANQDAVERRVMEYRALRTLPFCKD